MFSSLSNNERAKVFASSVLPTPVGPRNINEPIGLFSSLSPALARITAFDTAVTPVSDIEISKESSIQIDGLDTGTYRLIETKAPEGYVKPTGYIEITLEDTVDENSKNVPDGKLDKIEITNNGTYEIINNATTGSGSFSFIVKNRTPEDFNLPVTGGTGTLMFTLGGIVVMGGAVLLYARNRKCRSNAK